MRVAVVGAGSWGTTMAVLAARRGFPTLLWTRRPQLAADLQRHRENPAYLPGVSLPDIIVPTAHLEHIAEASVILVAVPSHGFRRVLGAAADHLAADAVIVSLSKGIEAGTLLRMTQIAHQVLPGHDPARIGVLTGPNLATEIAAGQPAATVVAMGDPSAAGRVQDLLMSDTLRVYTNPDVVGCEAAGAVKNVMAIAAGMAAGLGYGDNTLAALITRALAELTRLGLALGGKPPTFAGLAGMGDLIATCTSEKSRNHRVGVGLGRGRSLEEITSEMRMVAEGVKTAAAVLALADRHRVEMPIVAEVGHVLHEGKAPGDAVATLMTRDARGELDGIS
ncbi:MAG: NAD(P)H-dependent glycerol-3-phosphate dehydrogenase [Acidimicrobiia bacterium]